MFELIVTVYLLAADGRTLIDRHPPRPPVTQRECVDGMTAVLSAPRDATVRVVAYCAPKG